MYYRQTGSHWFANIPKHIQPAACGSKRRQTVFWAELRVFGHVPDFWGTETVLPPFGQSPPQLSLFGTCVMPKGHSSDQPVPRSRSRRDTYFTVSTNVAGVGVMAVTPLLDWPLTSSVNVPDGVAGLVGGP